ncbi:MAG: RagB/SusD family nutrient uptake outer membrane protein [Bacteroidales bacterium]|jgi:hypothetical protein|nr:RagB/SusD family nutrient uptake outer membrane protein [Bacteroidales bacterium]
MKNIIKFCTLFFAFGITTSSCNKWLEEKNYGEPTGEIFREEANIILLVGQAYADLKWLHDHWGYWGINTLTSDEATCPVRSPGDHWEDGGYWKNFATHNWTPNDDAFELLWQTSVNGAVGCNRILKILDQNKDVISEELYGEYVGELEVLRSYYFYTLFECFGRIPYTETFEESTNVELMTAAEVWHQLVNCIERNAPNMKVVTDVNRASLYGRVTQGFAYSLLARLYLNAESYGVTDVTNAYQKCADACDMVISTGSYIIEPDFFTNFAIKNENSKENIFVIVENGNAGFDARNWNGSQMMNKLRVTMLSLHYCHQQAWNLIEKPWNGFVATPELIELYDVADHRGPCPANEGTLATQKWGWFLGPITDVSGNILKDENKLPAVIFKDIKSDSIWKGIPLVNLADDNPNNDTAKESFIKADLQNPILVSTGTPSISKTSWNAGARLWKFEIDKVKANKFCENDFPLFRYADVLYMKAEAILRGAAGSIDYGGDMATIRTRVGMLAYNSGTLNLNELLNERGREFAWELIRRRDLIRFGKYDQAAFWAASTAWRGTVNTATYRNWLPLPKPILETSPIWTQNEGYIN